jgi:hypothetical protein
MKEPKNIIRKITVCPIEPLSNKNEPRYAIRIREGPYSRNRTRDTISPLFSRRKFTSIMKMKEYIITAMIKYF